MRIRSNSFLWLLILLGIILRITDVGLPDFSTDEAQLALGKSAAWTPLAMKTIVIVQSIFGFETIVARGVSVVIGIATIPLIYFIARHFFEKQTALLATAIAAIFPSHILFSRFAYPSIYLCFAWLLTLLCFLEVKKAPKSTRWMIGLMLASVAATFIKSQGLVFPALLILGLLIKKRKDIYHDEIAWVLLLSLIPVSFYFLTHPGVLATILLYGGNMYGVSGSFNRLLELIITWWQVLTLFAFFAIVSLRWFRSLSWPIWTLIATAALTGFLLGPAHAYYATHLILLALPITLLLTKLPTLLRSISIIALTITTILFLGPSSLIPDPYHLHAKEPYWNSNANKINEVLKGEDEIVVLEYPGHHLRWYLEPKLLVGRFMNLEGKTGIFMVLKKDDLPDPPQTSIVYEDEQVKILKR